MNLLAIDTALEDCSVAIMTGSAERAPVTISETVGRGHAERLFGMVEAAMREAGLAFANLDRIAVTTGPGSFTGLRVGIAAARGLALVIGCPVVGIGTLEAIAAAARESVGPVPVLAVLDAKRDEVYAEAFDAGGLSLSEPVARPAAGIASLLRDGMVLAGPGAGLVAACLPSPPRVVAVPPTPDIAAVLRLGAAAPPGAEPPRPLYLRAPDARPQAAAAIARR